MYEGMVTYTCLPGYNTSDTLTLTCNTSAVWDGIPPNCQSKWISCFKGVMALAYNPSHNS